VTDNARDQFLAWYPKIAKSSDIVMISGGGFLGSLWPASEEGARKEIRTLYRNRMVIFPQTIYFGDSAADRAEMADTAKVWRMHPDLEICARDRASYDRVSNEMEGIDPLRTHLIPDMVLYLRRQRVVRGRGVLLCFRHDRERITTKTEFDALIGYFRRLGKSVRMTDTVVTSRFVMTGGARNRRVERKLAEFQRSQLVVTDRLHGMLFAAITGTPCVALNNVSKKVEGAHDWIRHLPYVRMAESIEEVEAICADLLSGQQSFIYERLPLQPYFDELAKIVRGDRN
jgi:pyruvyl transferase EpsI